MLNSSRIYLKPEIVALFFTRTRVIFKQLNVGTDVILNLATRGIVFFAVVNYIVAE